MYSQLIGMQSEQEHSKMQQLKSFLIITLIACTQTIFAQQNTISPAQENRTLQNPTLLNTYSSNPVNKTFKTSSQSEFTFKKSKQSTTSFDKKLSKNSSFSNTPGFYSQDVNTAQYKPVNPAKKVMKNLSRVFGNGLIENYKRKALTN